MGAPKGRPKPPGSGRKKGTKTKLQQGIDEKLAALGCDPIVGMVEIAREARANGDIVLAGHMYKELAQYVAPKRKAVEHSGSIDGGAVIIIATSHDETI